MSSVIESFFNEIKNQFFTSIRVLRIDNALEYIKKTYLIFIPKMTLFIRSLVLIHPNKTENKILIEFILTTDENVSK